MQKKNGVTLFILTIIIILMIIIGTVSIVSVLKIVDMNKIEIYETSSRVLREKISTINDEVVLEMNKQKETTSNISYNNILISKYPELASAQRFQGITREQTPYVTDQENFISALDKINESHRICRY